MSKELKIRLILNSLKQKEIAAAAGVDAAYISRIVNGKQKPSSKVIKTLQALGIEVEEE